QPTVFIVDDDAAVRDALNLLVRSGNLPSESFAGAREFLAASADSRPRGLVLDVRMPGGGGPGLPRQLAARGGGMPIIMLTGHGDVPMAVQALRAGALDFIPKPFDSKALLKSIREAIDLDARTRQQHVDRAAIEARLAKLTPRETEVLNH